MALHGDDTGGPNAATAARIPSLLRSLRSLRILLAVARHGSTVRAAEAIHLSQPAVARAVIDLERTCGLALFARAARGMAPTPPGLALAARAEVLLQQLAAGAVEAVDAVALAARPPLAGRFAAVVSPGQLRALVAITTSGSESRAAAALGITQPAVHASLQRVEELVGVRLFDKLAAGTRLTPAGEALARRVRLALAELRAMEADVAAWQGEIRGRVVVGVLPLSVTNFLPRAVQMLVEQHPGIQVRIVDGTYESLVRQMLSADVDAIAGALRPDAPAGDVRQHHLFDDDLVVVARAGHPSLRRPPAQLADLLQWDWVTPLPDTPADWALDQVFRSAGVAPPPQGLQASSPAMTLAFVMQTGRLAIASRAQAVVDDCGGQLGIVPLELPSTMRRVGLATRAIGEPSPDLRLFVDACRACCQGRRLDAGRPRC